LFVHDPLIRNAALELIAAGLNDCEVSRRIGVPRRTIRDWRVPSYVPRAAVHFCWRCWRRTAPVVLTPDDYAELLGVYLGDGHVSRLARTERIRLMLDTKYPIVVEEAAELLRRVVPRSKIGRQYQHQGRMVTLHAYFKHWTCLLPQHGPGKKHDRPILLEPWQREHVERAPWSFLRGCIRSDGCVFINRTGRYEYESYDFSNLSRDILMLFASVCAHVGVECRVYARRVRVYRRDSVALMLEHVGRKT
jgi:hypothetical protein